LRLNGAGAALDTREVETLLDAVSGEESLERRIDFFSAYFIGRPYIENPLGGGAGLHEDFTLNLEGFDCVTYVETVLALAWSKQTEDFAELIRQLRYTDGLVAWDNRNHYMVDWAKNNQQRGFLKDLTCGRETVRKMRTLSVVEGLPRKHVKFLCFPREAFATVADRLSTGDLIFFGSVRKVLDVFHIGMLARKGDVIMLRHATRRVRAVVEQPLSDFFDANSMSGVILLRPAEPVVETHCPAYAL
jgi:N-acetylmuramoyl-L-alanine amidase-like protein